MSIFRWDSPFAQEVGRAADYVIINLLCFVCSLPIVTMGAALTARYYAAMKIARGEEPQVIKAFFKAFRENFKTATVLWMIRLAVYLLLAWDWYLIMKMDVSQINTIFRALLLAVTLFAVSVGVCISPFLARFEMSRKEYVKAAAILSFLKFPRIMLALLLIAAPYIIGWFYMKWLAGILLVLPALELYFNTRMFVKEFRKLEPEAVQSEQEEES